MINKLKIFTFWEPKERIPSYIKLCMQTWKKFLPEYEIVIIDYSNIDKYLGKNFYDKTLYADFPLMLQADAIRCALLNIYGGIWFDADTIITSSEIKNYLNISSEFVLINYHLAFIKANKSSYILKNWLKQINYRIEFYKSQKYSRNKLTSKIKRIFHLKLFKIMNKWNYLGNSIIDKYIRGNIPVRIARKIKLILKFPFLYDYIEKRNKFVSIDRIKINALPEILGKNSINNHEQIYKDFYFRNDYSKDIINNTKGIILLHNSWTPKEYKEMTKEEFFNQNNTLSNLLKTILS